MAQTSRPCKGCGEPIYRTAPVAPIPHYHGDECRPRCTVDGCAERQHSRTLCGAHYARWRKYSDVEAPRLRSKNEGPCSVEGCEQPMRKTGWCASHYAQWRRFGEVRPFTYKWADEVACLVCGKPNGEFKSRKFCSSACMVYWHRGKERPTNPSCVRCGIEIDLARVGKGGYRKRRDTKLCRKCKTMHSRHWASPGELALRDGSYCGICGCDVDVAAMRPDPMRASVDHVVPRAWGGSDEPSNLQLSHLWCNQVKSDRYRDLSSRSMP